MEKFLQNLTENVLWKFLVGIATFASVILSFFF